jgi:hypothetical protein
MVLTETQRSLLQVVLEIGEARFLEYAKYIDKAGSYHSLGDQFDRQAKEARDLLTLIVNAESIEVKP